MQIPRLVIQAIIRIWSKNMPGDPTTAQTRDRSMANFGHSQEAVLMVPKQLNNIELVVMGTGFLPPVADQAVSPSRASWAA
jgi:hypothetical protein